MIKQDVTASVAEACEGRGQPERGLSVFKHRPVFVVLLRMRASDFPKNLIWKQRRDEDEGGGR